MAAATSCHLYCTARATMEMGIVEDVGMVRGGRISGVKESRGPDAAQSVSTLGTHTVVS